MTVSVRMALAFVPLAIYFFVLGRWQSGRRPKVVSGPADFLLLAFGLGGMLAFGPIGGFVVGSVFSRPGLPAWIAVASFAALLAMVAASFMRTRVVVYHVEGPELIAAVGEAFGLVVGPASRTLRGFEDGKARRGVTVEVGEILRFGVVQAHGDHPEALAEGLAKALGENLGRGRRRSSPAASAWFALSGLVLLALVASWVAIVRPVVLGGR